MKKSISATGAMTVRQVLQNRNFRLLWSAQVISEIGDSLTNLSLFILVNRLTGSTAAIAFLSIILLVPQVVFGLLSGVYVDRLDRKRIMIVSDLLRGLLVLGFVVVGSASQVWLIYLLGFLQASIGTFFIPAQSAMLPNIVPAEGLVAANSLSQTSRTISLTVGGAAAGLLAGLTGLVWPAFVVDALTFGISVLLVSQLRLATSKPAATGHHDLRSTMRQLGDGIFTIFHNRALAGTLVAAGVALLGLGAVNVLFVPLLVNEIKASESWLGPVQFSATLAMIVSGSLVALLAARLRPPLLISLGLMAFGLAVGLSGAANLPWQLMLTQFVSGFCVAPINIAIATINQTAVSDEMRGRVGSARYTLASGANLLSMALAGTFGDLIGVRNVFFLAGLCVVCAGLVSGWIFRKLPVVDATPNPVDNNSQIAGQPASPSDE